MKFNSQSPKDVCSLAGAVWATAGLIHRFGSSESAQHDFLLLLLSASPASPLLKENTCLLFITMCWIECRLPTVNGLTHPSCAGHYASSILQGGFRFSEKRTPSDFTPVTVKFALVETELSQSWLSSRVHLKGQGQCTQDRLQVSTEDVLYCTIPVSNRDTSFIIQWQNVSRLFPLLTEQYWKSVLYNLAS